MKRIRIGCGQGFWGDWLEAPVNLVRQGPLDYLVLDYLAEVTMSILVKQFEKNPQLGYARDFVELIGKIGPDIVSKNIKVIANAGGVNPLGAAKAIEERVQKHEYGKKIRIAVVHGDNLLPCIEYLQQAGESLENLDDQRSFSSIQSSLRSANAYLGAEPIVKALAAGANIVITGRVADPCLPLAAMIHEFSWPLTDWDRLAAGVVAGHIIECGAQSSGGNYSFDWQSVPNLASIGYPIVEVEEDGTFVVTKHAHTGGRIDCHSVKEQLVYEIGDPRRYITPDVVADFSSLKMAIDGVDRVRISDVKGSARPEKLKASCSYFCGYTASGSILYSWPQAYEKSIAGANIVRQRLLASGSLPERFHFESIGVNACHASLASPPHDDIAEVMLRMSAFDRDKAIVERFTREITPLVLNGPPGATSYFGGKGDVHETIAYWPTLVRRDFIVPEMKIL